MIDCDQSALVRRTSPNGLQGGRLMTNHGEHLSSGDLQSNRMFQSPGRCGVQKCMRPHIGFSTKASANQLRDDVNIVRRKAESDSDKITKSVCGLSCFKDGHTIRRSPGCDPCMRFHLTVMAVGGRVHRLDFNGASCETLL